MKANPRSPFEIFAAPVHYVVPLYQRPYVWNEEAQWEPLWVDVRNVAEQVLQSSAPVASAEVPPHFLGAIVLDQQRGPVGFVDARHVIDGQQRLTTLQLLLDAARRVVIEHGSPAEASALTNLTRNDPAVASGDADVFKVWPTNYDRDAFAAVMGEHDTAARLKGHRVVAAHRFFREQTLEWAENGGDPDGLGLRLSALTNTLMRHLRVVVIDLEEGDNAQVIFETLNDRGTPLLAADLVKNRVFQLSQAEGIDVEQLYEVHWKPFDSNQWRRTIRRGRIRRPRIDVFLYYWLALRTHRVIAEDRLFTEFDLLLKREQQVLPLVNDFVGRSKVYDSLETFPSHSVEGTFTYRVLDTLEANLWGPVLLWLFGWGDDELPEAQRHLALRSLESWIVRRSVCRFTTKSFNRLMGELLRALDEGGPGSAGTTTLEFFESAEGDSEWWPDDETVRRVLIEEPLYARLKRARLRMILEALEDALRTPMSDEDHCLRRKLTIEHVMPQGWREHWGAPPGDEPHELAAARRDRRVHSLGNLTLVKGKLNQSLSNRPWTDDDAARRISERRGKRSILNEHTNHQMNRRIVDRWPDAWTDDDIVTRGLELADRFLQIWPGPDELSAGQR